MLTIGSRGRKSKYETHVRPRFEEIKAWRESGDSEETIAKKIRIAYSTLSDYKVKYSEFSEVLSHSKTNLINNLKKSLWKEAIGFDYDEIERNVEKIPIVNKKFDNNYPISEENQFFIYKEKTKVRKVTKIARSQSQLLIFALCNLCPEEFQRVDKEAVNRLEQELKERQNVITDAKIKNAFYALNPHIKKEDEEKNDKHKETKKE